MTEFYYFCSKSELTEVLNKTLLDNFRIQVIINLPTPTPLYLDSSKKISDAFSMGFHSFMLESDEYSRYPIALRRYVRDGEEFWRAVSREGGPVIEIYYFYPYSEGGESFLPYTMFTFHPLILNPFTNQLEKAGEEIKAKFRQLIQSLRRNSRKIVSTDNVRKAYISKDADRLIAEGWKLGQSF